MDHAAHQGAHEAHAVQGGRGKQGLLLQEEEQDQVGNKQELKLVGKLFKNKQIGIRY